MSDVVIRCEGLGKKYRIGANRHGRYVALRDVLAERFRSWGRRLAGRGRGDSGGSYEEIWALRDVSFEVKRGECVGIIGRNGAGKSTLLKLLSRITEPTEGRIRLRGRVASLLEVGTGFHPELTGRENIYLNGAILGMKRAEIRRKFDAIAAFAEVEKFLDTPVKHYSSGMYMRLAFAVAAHLEPEILIVDEVLAVGDAAFQKKCLGKMGEVAREGRTVLFVSHNMHAVSLLCIRAMFLCAGRLLGIGQTESQIRSYLSQIKEKAVSESSHRPGSGEYRYDWVAPVKRCFEPGEEKTFRFRIRRRDSSAPRPYLSACLIDDAGATIAQCDSRLIGYWPELNDHFEGVLGIRSPWLKPGTYRLDMYICSDGIVDQFGHACEFEVSPVLPFRFSASPDATAMGFVFADFAWHTTRLQPTAGDNGVPEEPQIGHTGPGSAIR